STRTLYQQVGNRENLIRALVARHLARLRLDFHEHEDWETTALQWCLGLHEALRAHPHLTELMTIDDGDVIMDYVNELVAASLAEGFAPTLADECCRALVGLTINHTIMEVRAMHDVRLAVRDPESTSKTETNFVQSIRWILAGVRAEAAQTPSPRTIVGTSSRESPKASTAQS
ncbi:hypothetical protein G3I15_08755, partial [Streptomyces sp. SID10244]|nr:hypothetical protein [Streptomyces sp. SID10244]